MLAGAKDQPVPCENWTMVLSGQRSPGNRKGYRDALKKGRGRGSDNQIGSTEWMVEENGGVIIPATSPVTKLPLILFTIVRRVDRVWS